MKTLKLYNSFTKKLEIFNPINENEITLYACGVTVYDKCHLGHAKTYITVDLLYRILKEIYGNVKYVRNITDIDDKINKRAVERKITIGELTEETIVYFNRDMKYLQNISPQVEPRATNHIKEIINMIERLIKQGYAYVSDDHVLFDIAKYKEYGKLSGRKTEDMIAGARIEVEKYKKNTGDFVLWKPSHDIDDESARFNSPWGVGRPGWHIECSAMSEKHLGKNFDIHCGGNDLKFPHHENEIAQSCCANEGSFFARYWFHVGFLLVNGDKMSKSLGNFITIEDLEKKGVRGATIRYAFMKNHYRIPFDFSDRIIDDANKNLKELHKMITSGQANEYDCNAKLPENVLTPLLNDLNTSVAIVELSKLKGSPHKLRKAMEFLGVYDESYILDNKDLSDKNISEEEINNLLEKRIIFKENKEWKKADEIRNYLSSMGIDIVDSKNSSTWRIK